MSFIRPLVWLLILFGALFILRDPLQKFNSNAEIIPSDSPFSKLWTSSNTATSTSSTTVESIPPNDKDNLDSDSPGIPETTKPVPGTTVSNKGIITPSNPTIKVEDSSLSINGIFLYTNRERTNRQFPALKNNMDLNKSAEKKLQDMFSNQYFEHQSPGGVNVSDLVRDEEYQFIVVGENLALGNFGGDPQVVTAWMNSPGHRANILDPRFQEIGIAVGKGSYKGKQQWIAVQHFAKPLSSCPGPNSELKKYIQIHTTDLADREKTLTILRQEIEATTLRDEAYNEKVEKYNSLVVDYNNHLESLKDEISRYNEQVRSFNSCAGLTAVKKVQIVPEG